jgi:preprotein translocase subunit SecE
MDSQANFLLGSIKELVVVEELRDIVWPLTPF